MSATAGRPGPEANTRIQAARRRQLIEATLSSIAEVGLSNVTLAKVAGHAGLTAAMVNFHFSGKESLLLETLRFVSTEFQKAFEDAMRRAGDDPVQALENIVETNFDMELSDPRRLAVWYAFWGERRARVDYQDICGAHDQAYEDCIIGLFRQLVEMEGKPGMDAEALAQGFMGLLDYMWQALMADDTLAGRANRAALCRNFLKSVLPRCFGGVVTADRVSQPVAKSRKWVCVGRCKHLHVTKPARVIKHNARPGLGFKLDMIMLGIGQLGMNELTRFFGQSTRLMYGEPA